MTIILYIALTICLMYIAYLKGKGKAPVKDAEKEKLELEREQIMSDHFDAVLNYTPEKAYTRRAV